MSAAPVLACLLREALPEAAVLDLGQPAWPVLPWWPGARCGLADAAALAPAEAALLRRFHQGPAGLPVLGLAGTADDDVPVVTDRPMLLVLDRLPPPALTPWLEAGAMILRRGRTEGMPPLPGPERGRIMLLGGSAARIERWDLLVPPEAVAPLFDRLHAAAHHLAASLGGSAGWQVGGRVASPSLASLGMLVMGPERVPPLAVPADALLHDLPEPASGAALPLGAARRVRLLLGGLPARPAWLRLRLRGADPARPPALFLDGGWLDQAQCRMEGETCVLEAPVRPRPDQTSIVGLALPEGAPPGLILLGLEVGP
ncbi:hypothetical protein [Roseicella aerolata]|uniref:Uncharacterized protein n=1 Tax=Roseicella aerolata TaxID=2883479 RepID=A0A9X1IIE9_9PROT|nr:hypothetical protein [Roseicella aerolata]MCB4823655.1 hypothetical protein [Roseicella aerolata]